MKVYKAIRDTLPGELGMFFSVEKGDYACQEKNNVFYRTKGYPLYCVTVEGNPDLFELFLEDDVNDPDYYIKPLYTQYQYDQLCNSINQK